MKAKLIAVSILLFNAPAFAAHSCKPVVGHFEASLVPPGRGHCPADPNSFCTAGRVWGGIQGTYQFVMTGQHPSILLGGVPTILFFTGKSTVFLKSGDQVAGTDTGSIDLPPGQGGFASLISFDGGTGQLSGASGQIRLRGENSAPPSAPPAATTSEIGRAHV